MIKYCKNCAEKGLAHDFQDKTYGKFVRVQNPCTKKTSGSRCTICRTVN